MFEFPVCTNRLRHQHFKLKYESEIKRNLWMGERAAEMQDGYNGWTQALQINSREEEQEGNLAFQKIISSFHTLSLCTSHNRRALTM